MKGACTEVKADVSGVNLLEKLGVNRRRIGED